MKINKLSEIAHKVAREKGFYDKYDDENKRSITEFLMLIVTELSEACEADRNSDFDKFKEEIADTYIRLGDMCGYLDIDVESEILKKVKINKNREYKHGKKY